MDMTGEHRINLPQAQVWQALNDPDILKASIPGCEELIKDGDDKFRGRISASVGPVRAKFSGEAALSEIDPPNGYVLTGSGSGGAAGMAKGSAAVRLAADGEATILRFEVKAQVAGKLAQIGSRLVDMAAKKMADEFFANFAARLEPIAPAEAPTAFETPSPELQGADAEGSQTQDPETPAMDAAVEPASAPLPDFAPGPIPAPVPDALETSSQTRPGWLVWAAIAVLIILAVAAYLVAR